MTLQEIQVSDLIPRQVLLAAGCQRVCVDAVEADWVAVHLHGRLEDGSVCDLDVPTGTIVWVVTD